MVRALHSSPSHPHPAAEPLSASSGERGLPLACTSACWEGTRTVTTVWLLQVRWSWTIERRLETLSWILWCPRFHTDVAFFWRKGLKFPPLEVFEVSNLTPPKKSYWFYLCNSKARNKPKYHLIEACLLLPMSPSYNKLSDQQPEWSF